MQRGTLNFNGATEEMKAKRQMKKKFDTEKTQWTLERELTQITPLKGEKAKSISRWFEKRIVEAEAANNGEAKAAYEFWRAFKEQEKVDENVDAEFKKDFLGWLQGKGKKEDHDRTPWGRNPEMVKLPSVRNWLGTFLDEKYDVIKALIELQVRTPRTLNEAYLYFKYLIRDGMAQDDTLILQDFDRFLGGQNTTFGDDKPLPQRLSSKTDSGWEPHDDAVEQQNDADRRDKLYKQLGTTYDRRFWEKGNRGQAGPDAIRKGWIRGVPRQGSTSGGTPADYDDIVWELHNLANYLRKTKEEEKEEKVKEEKLKKRNEAAAAREKQIKKADETARQEAEIERHALLVRTLQGLPNDIAGQVATEVQTALRTSGAEQKKAVNAAVSNVVQHDLTGSSLNKLTQALTGQTDAVLSYAAGVAQTAEERQTRLVQSVEGMGREISAALGALQQELIRERDYGKLAALSQLDPTTLQKISVDFAEQSAGAVTAFRSAQSAIQTLADKLPNAIATQLQTVTQRYETAFTQAIEEFKNSIPGRDPSEVVIDYGKFVAATLPVMPPAQKQEQAEVLIAQFQTLSGDLKRKAEEETQRQKQEQRQLMEKLSTFERTVTDRLQHIERMEARQPQMQQQLPPTTIVMPAQPVKSGNGKKAELTAAQQEIRALERDLATYRTEHVTTKQKIERLKEQNRQKQEKLQSKKQKFATVLQQKEAELNQLRTSAAASRPEPTQTKEEIKKLVSERDEARTKLRQLEREQKQAAKASVAPPAPPPAPPNAPPEDYERKKQEFAKAQREYIELKTKTEQEHETAKKALQEELARKENEVQAAKKMAKEEEIKRTEAVKQRLFQELHTSALEAEVRELQQENTAILEREQEHGTKSLGSASRILELERQATEKEEKIKRLEERLKTTPVTAPPAPGSPVVLQSEAEAVLQQARTAFEKEKEAAITAERERLFQAGNAAIETAKNELIQTHKKELERINMEKRSKDSLTDAQLAQLRQAKVDLEKKYAVLAEQAKNLNTTKEELQDVLQKKRAKLADLKKTLEKKAKSEATLVTTPQKEQNLATMRQDYQMQYQEIVELDKKFNQVNDLALVVADTIDDHRNLSVEISATASASESAGQFAYQAAQIQTMENMVTTTNRFSTPLESSPAFQKESQTETMELDEPVEEGGKEEIDEAELSEYLSRDEKVPEIKSILAPTVKRAKNTIVKEGSANPFGDILPEKLRMLAGTADAGPVAAQVYIANATPAEIEDLLSVKQSSSSSSSSTSSSEQIEKESDLYYYKEQIPNTHGRLVKSLYNWFDLNKQFEALKAPFGNRLPSPEDARASVYLGQYQSSSSSSSSTAEPSADVPEEVKKKADDARRMYSTYLHDPNLPPGEKNALLDIRLKIPNRNTQRKYPPLEELAPIWKPAKHDIALAPISNGNYIWSEDSFKKLEPILSLPPTERRNRGYTDQQLDEFVLEMATSAMSFPRKDEHYKNRIDELKASKWNPQKFKEFFQWHEAVNTAQVEAKFEKLSGIAAPHPNVEVKTKASRKLDTKKDKMVEQLKTTEGQAAFWQIIENDPELQKAWEANANKKGSRIRSLAQLKEAESQSGQIVITEQEAELLNAEHFFSFQALLKEQEKERSSRPGPKRRKSRVTKE